MWPWGTKRDALGGSIDPNLEFSKANSAIMEIDYVIGSINHNPLSIPPVIENELKLLYPNPSDGNFQIESEIQIDEVYIYNLNGQKLQFLL